MEIKDRMEQFRLEQGLTVQKFEQLCGISNGGWAKAKEVSERNLIRFIRTYPEVDANWLLKGKEIDVSADIKDASNIDVNELMSLCKSLVKNYQQRDEVMCQLTSILMNTDL